MGKLNLNIIKQKKAAAAKKQKPKVPEPLKRAEQEKNQLQKKIVNKGYARKGDRVATIRPAVPGKSGKNIHGESIPVKSVFIPTLTAGKNIRVDGGLLYYMTTDGIIEVYEYEDGTRSISGRVYQYGRFSISVSDDEMAAYLRVVPSLGGAGAVRLEDVLSTCIKHRIVFGIRKEAILQAIEKAEKDRQPVKNIVIAKGVDQIDGEDGRIEYKVRLATGDKFKLLEGGKVDYREQDLITTVKEGQVFAVIHKAREGIKNGSTVTGKTLHARKGSDIEVKTGNNVRRENRGDIIHLLASRDGLLQDEHKILSVEPLLVVPEDVGPKTGNINYNGVVIIKGNVQDNYRVYAKKNITVMGNVKSAVVRSDENITVVNGIISNYRGLVYAKGDLRVKFAENSSLQAGGSIYIRRAALNCKITAGDRIIANTDKGQLMGGEIKATRGIEVKVLGNELEHKMEVFVGSDFFLENRLKELRLSLSKYEANMKKIQFLLEKINQVNTNPDELPDNLKKVYTDAMKKKTLFKLAISDLLKKETQYNSKVHEKVDAEIIAHESLFRGVRIYFGKTVFETEKMKTRVKVYYDEEFDKISVGGI